MELNRHRIEVPNETTVVKLYAFGDVHLGATNCDYEAAEKTRDMIARDPHAYAILMGDTWDGIMPSDKRWDAVVQDWKRLRAGTPDESDLMNDHYRLGYRFMEPIKDKIIGVHKGNHEDTLERYYYTNFVRRLCADLDLPYLGYTAMTRLEIGIASQGRNASGIPKRTITLDIFSEHGGAGGGTDGNAINNLQKRLEQFNAEVYLKGHVHKRGIWKRTELAWGPAKPLQRTRVGVLTGTYLRGYEAGMMPYAERKGMPPNEIGGCVVLIRPRWRHGSLAAAPEIDAVYTEAVGMLAA